MSGGGRHPFCDCGVYSNDHPIGLGKCTNPVPDHCWVPRTPLDDHLTGTGVKEWLDRIKPSPSYTQN